MRGVAIVQWAPERVVLQARRAVWEAMLAGIPERPRGEDRPAWERIRSALTAALASPGDVLRVTLLPEDARRCLMTAR